MALRAPAIPTHASTFAEGARGLLALADAADLRVGQLRPAVRRGQRCGTVQLLADELANDALD
jgi:hypothetical protein